MGKILTILGAVLFLGVPAGAGLIYAGGSYGTGFAFFFLAAIVCSIISATLASAKGAGMSVLITGVVPVIFLIVAIMKFGIGNIGNMHPVAYAVLIGIIVQAIGAFMYNKDASSADA